MSNAALTTFTAQPRFVPRKCTSENERVVHVTLGVLLRGYFDAKPNLHYRCHYACGDCNRGNGCGEERSSVQSFSSPTDYGGSVVCLCLDRVCDWDRHQKGTTQVTIPERQSFPFLQNGRKTQLEGTLVGVVLHHGRSGQEGHYTTLARRKPSSEMPDLGLFFKFDDTKPPRAQAADVLQTDVSCERRICSFTT